MNKLVEHESNFTSRIAETQEKAFQDKIDDIKTLQFENQKLKATINQLKKCRDFDDERLKALTIENIHLRKDEPLKEVLAEAYKTIMFYADKDHWISQEQAGPEWEDSKGHTLSICINHFEDIGESGGGQFARNFLDKNKLTLVEKK